MGALRVVATAGHVDHGKSSLVLAMTGTDPDRFAEEKQRGLTIDLGFAHLALPSGDEISFVDVPGHSRFVGNMLAGVGGVDACLFVVAATEGWMPQSEEHLRILELAGVRHGVIAMTKRGLVDDEWAEIAEIEIADRVAGTFLADAPIVAVDSLDGTGLDELVAALEQVVATTPASADRGRPRMWIDRSFAASGSGTVVTGTLTGGQLHRDDVVVVWPGGRSARVRAIESHGERCDEIGPGHRVALNLSGVSRDEVARGDVVVEPDRWHLTDRVDAELSVLASLDHAVSRRGAYVAYVGSREVPVKVRVLGDDAVAPGEVGAIRVFSPVELPLLPGDRYVLRESGRHETVGGGEILDVDPIVKASKARPDRSLTRVIAERGWIEVDELERLTGERVPATAGRWVTTPADLAHTQERLVEMVTEAGEAGLDVAVLADHERAVLDAVDEVRVEGSWARLAGAADPFVDHPVIGEVLAGGWSPEPPSDRAAARELVRRGVLVERDRIVFHREAIDEAARLAATMLAEDAEGFTVAAFRDRAGVSRKFVLALLAELDARGVTRRRGDVRIGGPRLPQI